MKSLLLSTLTLLFISTIKTEEQAEPYQWKCPAVTQLPSLAISDLTQAWYVHEIIHPNPLTDLSVPLCTPWTGQATKNENNDDIINFENGDKEYWLKVIPNTNNVVMTMKGRRIDVVKFVYLSEDKDYMAYARCIGDNNMKTIVLGKSLTVDEEKRRNIHQKLHDFGIDTNYTIIATKSDTCSKKL